MDKLWLTLQKPLSAIELVNQITEEVTSIRINTRRRNEHEI